MSAPRLNWRQAATVLPPVEPSTYGSPKGSAARIYRAAG